MSPPFFRSSVIFRCSAWWLASLVFLVCGLSRSVTGQSAPLLANPSVDATGMAELGTAAKVLESLQLAAASSTVGIPSQAASVVVAQVGEQPILFQEVLSRTLSRETQIQQMRVPESQKMVQHLRTATLNQLVERLLLAQWAQSEGITTSSAELDIGVLLLRQVVGDEFDALLEQSGYDETWVMDELKLELSSDVAKSHFVDGKIRVEEQDLQDYYSRHRVTRFLRPSATMAYRLDRYLEKDEDEAALLRLRQSMDHLREEIVQQVQSSLELAEKIEVFGEFVKRYSMVPEAGEHYSVVYGDQPHGDFDAGFMQAIQETAIGEVSAVYALTDRLGYTIVMVTQVIPQQQAPFEQVRSFIRGLVQEEQVTQLNESLLESARQRFPVTVYGERLKQGLTQ